MKRKSESKKPDKAALEAENVRLRRIALGLAEVGWPVDASGQCRYCSYVFVNGVRIAPSDAMDMISPSRHPASCPWAASRLYAAEAQR